MQVEDNADANLGFEAKARVLVVEDDFFVAMDLQYELSKAGFDVVGIAVTSEEAIALARKRQPAVAIMDIRLASTRDGIDTAIQLFRDFKIRSIFASAHNDDATRRRADPAHPIGWISKPYAVESILDLLKSLPLA